MAKQSQLDKALAALRGERDILNLAIAKLESQQSAKVAPTRKSRSRARVNGEGAATDSANA
jgi:molybdopterin-guanine dinucleotide biosynthesis protein A